MFAIEVEYLTGRAVATLRHRREAAEWPPHPGRLFSALVDAAFQAESVDGSTLPDDIEAALKWLEEIPPPAIAVSEAQRREVIPAFVPVNDVTSPEVKPDRVPSAGQIADAVSVLPDGRGKQPRFFPTVIPDDPLVHFVWEDASDADKHRPALERLTQCVTYLGHSSSLVRAAIVESHGPITYRPDPNGRHTFRVPARGRLADLISHFRRNARPSAGFYAAYARLSEERKPSATFQIGSAFGDIIVCELEKRNRPMLTGAIRFLGTVRDAIISRVDKETEWTIRERVKSLVSGHTPDGGVSREEHVAYIPLANVGPHPYADGTVMGFGVLLPRELGRFSPERRAILSTIARMESIRFAGSDIKVAIPTENIPKSLETGPYTGASRWWATVTPILCDRYPKEKDDERLEDILAQSVERVAGVLAVRIVTDKISRHFGVPPSHTFPNRRKPDDQPRHRVHAIIEFDNEVRGPLIVGAGRYQGLGLLRRWNPEGRR